VLLVQIEANADEHIKVEHHQLGGNKFLFRGNFCAFKRVVKKKMMAGYSLLFMMKTQIFVLVIN